MLYAKSPTIGLPASEVIVGLEPLKTLPTKLPPGVVPSPTNNLLASVVYPSSPESRVTVRLSESVPLRTISLSSVF